MRIALIQARICEANTFIPPLGILYIASYLRHQGHAVIALDVDPDVDNPLPRLVDFSPDIVGFSLMTVYYRKTDKLIRHLKKYLPKSLICAGGIHSSALPERTVRELGGGIDFVVVGEGEFVLAEVVNKIEVGLDYQHVAGTVHLVNQKVIYNGRAPLRHDLDLFPFPARDLLDMEKYLTPPGFISGSPFARTTHLITSRGCPAACIYCGNQVLFERGVRQRSVENVIAEIEELVDTYNLNGLGFVDDTFMLNTNWVKKFCYKLIEKNWNLKWACGTRADTITDELVQLMYKAGCRRYEIGAESGSDRILKLMKKGLTTEQIAKGYKIAKRNGMSLMTPFIIGFPTETEEDIQMTLRFAKRIKSDLTLFFFLTPYPGTELYHMAIENGWIPKNPDFGEEWSIRQAKEPIMAIEFTPQKLKKLRANLQNLFFIKNFLSSVNFTFMLFMFWSLFWRPKELFRSIGLVLQTGRLDYLAEGALRAYRYKVEQNYPHKIK